jgi:hypothetical protein
MTLTIKLDPETERGLLAQAQAKGVSLADYVQDIVAREAHRTGRTIAEQGLGLFSSPEDAALLDEVVSRAYAERRRPSERKPTL